MIKKINALKSKKERDKASMFLLEGERLVSEIPKDWEVHSYVFSESFYNSSCGAYKKAPHVVLKDGLFKAVSDTDNPQGIMAVCMKKQHKVDFDAAGASKPFFLLLEEVMDPGNMGTIIRTADACGVSGVFLSKGCVDLYNPKVLRATMGSFFHLPIYTDANLMSVFDELKARSISVIAAHLKGDRMLYDVDFDAPCAVLIGNEANGLSDALTEKSDTLVKIPIIGKAESINASVACGVLLYEVVRQRGFAAGY